MVKTFNLESKYNEIYSSYKMIVSNLHISGSKKHQANIQKLEQIEEVLFRGADDNIVDEFSKSIISRIENVLNEIIEISERHMNLIGIEYDSEREDYLHRYIRDVNEKLLVIEGLMSEQYKKSRIVDKNTMNEIREFQKKYGYIEDIIDNLKRIEAITNNENEKVNTLIRELQHKLNVSEATFSTGQLKMDKSFQKFLAEKEDGFKLYLNEVKKQIEEETDELNKKSQKKNSELMQESDNVLAEIREKLNNANLLISAAGEKALNDGYKNYSSRAAKAKLIWQIIAIIPMICIVFIAIRTLGNIQELLELEYVISKIFFTTSLVGVAGYCMRQARVAYLDEKKYKDMELKLGTIGAYLSDFEIKKQHEIKENLVQDYFSVINTESENMQKKFQKNSEENDNNKES